MVVHFKTIKTLITYVFISFYIANIRFYFLSCKFLMLKDVYAVLITITFFP